MKKLECSTPGCTECNTLYLHSSCHINSPTWAVLSGNVLTIECAECKKVVARFIVEGMLQ